MTFDSNFQHFPYSMRKSNITMIYEYKKYSIQYALQKSIYTN